RVCHRALGHLDIAAYSMLTVDHRVAIAQLERVDLILAACRHLPALPLGAPRARKIRRSEQCEPDLVGHEAVAELARHDCCQTGRRRFIECRRTLYGDRVLTEHLDDPSGGTAAFGRDDHAPAI